MNNKLQIACAFIALAAAIVLVVFTIFDIPGQMLAQSISGLVLIVTAIIWFIIFTRGKKIDDENYL